MPYIDLNTIKLDDAPDYNNPVVRSAALKDVFEPNTESTQSGQYIDLNNIKLDSQPKTALGALPQTPANNAYGINPLSPEQSAIGAARMYGDIQNSTHQSQNSHFYDSFVNTSDKIKNQSKGFLSSLANTGIGGAVGSSIDASQDVLGNIYSAVSGNPYKEVQTTPQLDILKQKGWSKATNPERVGAITETAFNTPLGKLGQIFAGSNIRGAATMAGLGEANPIISKATGIDERYLVPAEMLIGSKIAKGEQIITDTIQNKVIPKVQKIAGRLEAKSQNANGLLGDISSSKPQGQGTTSQPTTTSEAIREAQKPVYKEAEKLGANFTSAIGDNFQSHIESLKPKPLSSGKYTEEQSAFLKDISDFEGMQGKPMNLSQFADTYSELGKKANKYVDPKTGNYTDTGRKFIDLQSKLRDSIENITPENITSGVEGLNLIRKANSEWAKQANLQKLELMKERADMTDNGATSMKSQARSLVMNKKEFNRFQPSEQKAIRNIARNGVFDKSLWLLDSIATPIAGGFGAGFGGAVIGQGVKSVAHSIRASRTAGKLNRAMNEVINRPSPKMVKEPIRPEPFEPMPTTYTLNNPIPSLPTLEGMNAPRLEYKPTLPASSDFAVSQGGVAARMGTTEQQNANAARQRASELGLTSDVLRAQQNKTTPIQETNQPNESKNIQKEVSQKLEINKPSTIENVAFKMGGKEKREVKIKFPSTTGNPTSLGTFIRNNGGMSDPLGEMKGYKNNRLMKKSGLHWDDMFTAAKEAGYFDDNTAGNDFINALDKDAGSSHYRKADIGRLSQIQEKSRYKSTMEEQKYSIEKQALELGLIEDTEGLTDNDYYTLYKLIEKKNNQLQDTTPNLDEPIPF